MIEFSLNDALGYLTGAFILYKGYQYTRNSVNETEELNKRTKKEVSRLTGLPLDEICDQRIDKAEEQRIELGLTKWKYYRQDNIIKEVLKNPEWHHDTFT